MQQIPLNDFKRHYKAIEGEISTAINRVLESGWYILGTEVETFEKSFANYNGSKYCVSVANGTEAISLALMALDIGRGDEVLTTALTAYPTITAIEMVGAIPVVLDVNSHGLIDSHKVESLITKKTKAIIPVHLYGQLCDMDKLMNLSRQYSIPIIEDCAQSSGAKRDNIHCGNFGVMGCFSFYPTKNLGAFGDGGAIMTNDAELSEKLKSLRNYGQTIRYYHKTKGINSRLDEIQAAILSVKLPYLDSWNSRRREIAEKYSKGLPKTIQLPRVKDGDVFHLYPILVSNREVVMNKLKDLGIGTVIHYPIPTYKQEAFNGQATECPQACHLSDKLLSLPIYPELSDDEVEYVIKSVLKSL